MVHVCQALSLGLRETGASGFLTQITDIHCAYAGLLQNNFGFRASIW